MITKKYLICCLVLLSVYVSASSAAVKSYLQIEGETQGPVDGESEQPGHEDEIEVTGFSHDTTMPRDPSTGLPTGLRCHAPVKITKQIDSSSPKLMQALDSSEKFTVFRLSFMRMNDMMVLEDYYVIELTNAQIVGVRQKKLNTLNPDNDWSADMESVWFTYDSINWTYDPNGTPVVSAADWDFQQSYALRISDLNYDGTVNMLDLAVLAEEWLESDNW